jgi:hypothetical protein
MLALGIRAVAEFVMGPGCLPLGEDPAWKLLPECSVAFFLIPALLGFIASVPFFVRTLFGTMQHFHDVSSK